VALESIQPCQFAQPPFDLIIDRKLEIEGWGGFWCHDVSTFMKNSVCKLLEGGVGSHKTVSTKVKI
jgi:hypothetical protein